MATVSTVTPTVVARDQIPPTGEDETLSGTIDLSTVVGWSFVSSFAFPVPSFEITYNSGGPSIDIGGGRVARTEDDGQRLLVVEGVTGVSLAASTTNYVYYRSDDVIEVRDADNPPSADAILVAIVDTASGQVRESVRGRNPISQFTGSSGGSTGECCNPLQAVTLDATNIADSSATMRGRLDGMGGASSVDVFFQWRAATDSQWTQTTQTAKTAFGEFEQTLLGLNAGDTYVYRAGVIGANSGVDFGGERTLTTTNDGTTNPTVITYGPSNVGVTSATLNGDLTSLGSYTSVDVYFEYREVGQGSWSTTTRTAQSSTGAFSDSVSTLRSSTNYEFRAAAATPNGAVTGGIVTFTTGQGQGIQVTTNNATEISDSSATLNGTLDAMGSASSVDVAFEYRQVGATAWQRSTSETLTVPQSFDIGIGGLQSQTDYEFRAVAESQSDSATGGTATFTTIDIAQTLTVDDGEILLVDASVGTTAVELPSPTAELFAGAKKTDSTSNAVILQPPSGEIDGLASVAITRQYAQRQVTSDGSEYWIV